MLTPTKHAHPDGTVLAAATVALDTLRDNRILRFDELRDALASKVRGVEYLMMPAMSFLYLLGLVTYHGVSDAFEYVGPQ
ncbi:ABC-three component system middle component 8 [Rathayibacter sp. AY1E2]|uniref:ABC-three component system middle component 8 n=1 Tax=Rathayibacter sp. AY1E2 TaxID=2080550 RepID=UPI000CE78DA1|nr:hypothetical protein C5C49_06105 [Rathayibacter sp. AY1E2]